MKTILITGINGFLGSHLAKRLSGNYNIVGLEYSLENLYRLKGYSFPVYLSDNDSIKKIFKIYHVDIVIHMSTFYGKKQEELALLFDSNLLMPFTLLDSGIKNNVEVFINTDTALERFVSAYALTKKQFHDWLYFRKNVIKVINMQLEHFYGPGCSETNFITSMIAQLQRNEPRIDLTLGEQKRDFIYYSDVIDAYKLVLSKYESINDHYSHFEVGTGTLISIRDLMVMLKDETKSSSVLNFGAISYRENEIMVSSSDNSKLVKLGWSANISLTDGIVKTINKRD
jgi:CDP-paratose synthetase